MPTATETARITVDFQPQGTRLKTGQMYTIVVPRPSLKNARWLGADDALLERLALGQPVKLVADARGLSDGSAAVFRVLCPARGSADDPVLELQGAVKGGRVEAEWTNAGEAEVPLHEYSFLCTAGGKSARSQALTYTDSVELALADGGKPCAGVEYVLTLGDGSERRGKLDAEGHAKVEDLPAGACHVRFEVDGDVELA